MTITRKRYYCFEELISDLNSKGYSDYKLNALLDQAIDNYSITNQWYIDYYVSLAVHVELLSVEICLN